jgi:hypothetical protein
MDASKQYSLQMVVVLVLSLGTGACNSVDTKPNIEKPVPVKFSGGERKNGKFDVSLEYGPDGVGWLAYSSVDIPKFIETHIARSTDNGQTWRHVTGVRESAEDTVNIRGKSTKGVWRDETPCLLYDPKDKLERRWKLFTNHYFTTAPYKPKNRLLGEGTIDVKYASTPAGPWSMPECVVGSHKHCKINIKHAHPDLSNVEMNTEPGVIYHNGVIYLSMDAGTVGHGLGDWKNYRIIMLSSSDHGETWRYTGTLLDHRDAMKFGYMVFTGTSLVRSRGKLYVLATPSGSTRKSQKGHDGTMVIEIADIERARVKRDKAGKPVIAKRLELSGGGSGGLADYDEKNSAGGVIFSTVGLLGFPEIFRIHQTGRGITGSD